MYQPAYLVAIDGASSVLRYKFMEALQEKGDNVVVHIVKQFQSDLDEVLLNIDENAALLYARRIKHDEQFLNSIGTVNVFNRMPASVFVYQLLGCASGLEKKLGGVIYSLKKNNICENYKCFILLDKHRHSYQGLNKAQNDIYERLVREFREECVVFEIDDDANHEEQVGRFVRLFNMERYNWKSVRTCHIYRHNFPRTTRLVAGFDLYNTLIMTRSRRLFPENRSDWEFKYNKVVIQHKLRRLLYAGFMLVVFTNQNGIRCGHVSLQDMYTMIHEIMHELNLPITVLMATSRDYFRKPHTGMMDLIVEKMPVDVSRSRWIFVGDNSHGTSFNDSDFAEATGMLYVHDSNFFNLNVMFE
ncbi:NRK-1 [Betabaculovirus altermyunipunctae]|uniref:NRK-1 n=1 Tax=Betabaculovirus altermyunipunctae TaxID=3051996 RepID=A0A1S5YDW3_9BBAC|nr:NRK-1 [Betabaculovirus altermyunipunctae]AQQ80289.1 NRK-1 [Betabaculovirus altermyunipunctae]